MSYGYSKETGQKVQEIVPSEAKMVKEIFAKYIDDNISMTGIAKSLNKRKISKKMKGKRWDAKDIKGILTNPTYIGKVRYSTADASKYFETEGHHEAIISEEQFYLVQDKIKNTPNISRTKRPRESSYFCGVLTCGCCGGKFTTHNHPSKIDENGEKQFRVSYRCANKIYHNDDIACKSPSIIHDKVENAFVEYIKMINDFTEAEEMEIENDREKIEREMSEYVANCERDLLKLQNRRRKIMEQYASDEISFEEYKSLLEILNRKQKTLENERNNAQMELPEMQKTPDLCKGDIIADLQENWELLNNNERMMFLQRFVKKLIIQVEKEHAKSNTVKIEGLEFNLYSEMPKKMEKGLIRQKMGEIQRER